MAGVTYVPILAQLGEDFFSNREGAAERCPGNNGLCLGWVADNFSDYLNPLWEHVLLSIVPLTPEVAADAAVIRGIRRLTLPDAIHLATARAAGATAFVTNDRRMRGSTKLEVVYLGDLEPDEPAPAELRAEGAMPPS